MNQINVLEFANKVIDNVDSISPIGHHHLKRHLVYKVSSGQSFYVLKMYFKQNKWNREVSALRVMNEFDENSPKIIAYDIIDDVEYLLMEFIDGSVLEDTIVSNLSEVYYDLGRYVGKSHRNNKMDYFGILNADGSFKFQFSTWKEYFLYEVDRHFNNLKKWNHLDPRLIKEGITTFYELVDSLEEAIPTLIHNDVSKRNIFVKDDAFLTLIDYEQSCVQDRYRELVIIEYHLNKDDMFDFFMEGYLEEMDFNEKLFNKHKKIYLLHYGLAICSWSLDVEIEHYKEGMELIKTYIKTV